MDAASLLDLLLTRMRQDPSPMLLQAIANTLGPKGIPYSFDGNALTITLPLPGRVASLTVAVRPTLAAPFGPQPLQGR